MGLIGLILTIAILGLVVWLITTYIPMPKPFQIVIYVIVAVVLIVYLMRLFNIADIPLR